MSANSGWRLGGIHHVGLTVSDIEASVRFYRDLLGLELIGRRPRVTAPYIAQQTGYKGVEMSVASFNVSRETHIGLEVVQYLTQSGETADQSTNRPGNSHLCLTVDNLVECHRDLRAKGVQFKSEPVPITAGPNEGGLVVYFYDPDGHVLELFQPPARQGD